MRKAEAIRTLQIAATPVVVAAALMLTGSMPASAGGDCPSGQPLCNAKVTSDILEPNLDRAIDLVFVSEGYRADQMGEFRDHAYDLVDSLALTTRFLTAREPTLFNIHLVEVPTTGGSVNDDVVTDTPLGASLGPPEGALGRRRITMDAATLDAAGKKAPDLDVVVAVIRGSDGRANADRPAAPRSWGRVRISTNDVDPHNGVFVHELGHAIFGLGDEYGGFGGCATEAGVTEHHLATYPNLSTNPSGAKWAHIHDGAHEGGRGFSECIYHPTGRCKMQSYGDEFCSVCQHAIAQHLERRKCEGDTACQLAEAPPNLDYAEGAPGGCAGGAAGGLTGLASGLAALLLGGWWRRRR